MEINNEGVNVLVRINGSTHDRGEMCKWVNIRRDSRTSGLEGGVRMGVRVGGGVVAGRERDRGACNPMSRRDGRIQGRGASHSAHMGRGGGICAVRKETWVIEANRREIWVQGTEWGYNQRLRGQGAV